MAQRYDSPTAHKRMARDECPECGAPASEHSADLRFWIPRGCDLTPIGVQDRIAQYKSDANIAAVI